MTTAIRNRESQSSQFLAGAVGLLETLAGAARQHIDPPAARRALLDAMQAWPGSDGDRWWKWMVEAAASLGLRVRAVDGTLAEALDLVRFGAAAATWLTGPAPGAVVIVECGRRSARVAVLPEAPRPRSMSRRDLARHLDASPAAETVRWILLEPAAHDPVDDSGHERGRTQTPLNRLYALLRPEWPDVFVVLVFALFIGILTLATPIAVESLVNTVAFGQLIQPVVVLAAVLFVFLAFAAAIRAVQTYVVEIIQRRLFVRVAGELAWRLPRIHQNAYDRAYGPELINRFFDVVTVQKTAAILLLDGITIILGTAIGMTVLAFYHPWLLGFDLFLLALIAFMVFVLGRGAVPSSIKESKTKYSVAGWLEELGRCSATFKSDGGPDLATVRADRLIADYLTARAGHFRILMRQIAFALFLQALASTMLLGLGGWLVISGQLTLGQLVAAEMIVAIIVGTFAKLGKYMDAFYDLLTSVDKLGLLFDLPLERQSGVAHVEGSGAAAVRVRALSFHHPDHAAILRGMSFDLSPGECVAVTGPPGAGKSTLLDLLYGLRTPDSGHVELDGTDLRDIRPDALRRHVALVRVVEVFHGTLAENVHLHRPGIASSDVREALDRVGLLDEVLALPDGLETTLESTAVPLSGSQARRLMLARALAGHPRLLLIDGLLDRLSDAGIESLLPRLQTAPGCTLVIVSGRQRILSRLDRTISLSPRRING